MSERPRAAVISSFITGLAIHAAPPPTCETRVGYSMQAVTAWIPSLRCPAARR